MNYQLSAISKYSPQNRKGKQEEWEEWERDITQVKITGFTPLEVARRMNTREKGREGKKEMRIEVHGKIQYRI